MVYLLKQLFNVASLENDSRSAVSQSSPWVCSIRPSKTRGAQTPQKAKQFAFCARSSMVEQWPFKPLVEGPSPSGRTNPRSVYATKNRHACHAGFLFVY
ncbi:MAG: hypothetical protein UY45_C0002G0042 [Parcubacteria group bacterium GW2011_GWA1_49_26]|uniref:Uncharacterized protein n=1 Tax=Candidatus Yanofskybacteria bacterium GW2011_GWC1_48_11 TaxID=1619027 RepID=A0A837IPW6_9BACT|nr:MAG: hypothetical protein UY25_C0002G0042 [Candidatus Yanofskybacteria bacterium GW2011_GWC1_48_11]KKW04711.1 MAG: hypothetical protein UY38_C0001G0278 [Parcubacteria group bacterium GW2011_GWB1_49_12]KKW08990.1 MAG: hypothetical protein UY45_C0002G0042 [Parcubacteria group bacterium GW2011_GWA1_49_26]